MSMPYNFELLKNGEPVALHYWRSWQDPEDAKAYKSRCILALNGWYACQGQEYGGTIKHIVPMIPDFDAIRFEWPYGTMVVVPIKSKAAVA